MFIRYVLALVIAVPGAVLAASGQPSELDQIRGELRELREAKQAYERHIQALEARVEQLEQQKAPAAPEQAPQTAPAPVASATTGAPASANAFNPAISLILQGTYTHAPDGTRLLPGFLSAGEIGPEERGFSLAETELNLWTTIDPYLYGGMALA